MHTDKKILVTSALPYVNNIPHLGTIIGCVLSADVFARAMRSMRGKDNVLYICGADEHGTATETKAKEEGLSPQALCDKYFAIHKGVYAWFDISFDIFGRTSLENHHQVTQDLFRKVDEAGFVKEQEVTQPFCEQCNKFLSDRFIEGSCPHCGYEDARGDQCDGCGKLLNPQDLLQPRCKADGTKPQFRSTKHLFLELDKLQKNVLEPWVARQQELGFWTPNAVRTTKAWFKEGLRPRAISRDLKWGIPIPRKGYEDKVFYVWFDAPIGYISITQQLKGEGYKQWWKDPQNVELYQFMGKDNIPFHSIIFPATLMAASGIKDYETDKDALEFSLVHHLNATEYINYEDGKFSKSRGTGVFGDDAIKTGIPSDVWRYYLLANRPETSDTIFSWQEFADRLNNELVATLGNLINRTMTFIKKFADGVIDKEPTLSTEDKAFWSKVKEKESRVADLLSRCQLREALRTAMEIARDGNAYFQAAEPWRVIKDDPARAKTSLFVLAHLCRDLAILFEPFLPKTAQSVFEQLAIKPQAWSSLGEFSLHGHVIGEPKHLFSKVEQSTIDELRSRFKGKQQPAAKQDEKVKDTPSTKQDSQDASPLETFKRFDLRVARITAASQHPNADKLFIEQLDLGPLGQRQICSGLKGYYTPEELVGKHIVVVANLKAAKLRGQRSEGMLLAAEDDKDNVGVIFAPDANPGDQVVIGGVEQAPAKKLLIDEFFSVQFTADKGVFLDGEELLVNGESLVVDKGVKGLVR